MTTISALFNAYIDANIIFVLAAVVWATVSFALARTRLRRAFSARLKVAYGVLISVALAPLAVFAFDLARQSGLVSAGYVVSVSDFAVAQYLDGRFEMAPSRFQTLLSFRETLVSDILELKSAFGTMIAAALLAGFGLAVWRTSQNIKNVRELLCKSYAWRQIGKIELRLTDAAHVPFSTRCWRRYYIVLPSALLSQGDDLKIAIAHELQHIRQGDLNWEIGLEALRPIFFWNPAFGYWKSEIEKLRELACDQQVLVRRRFEVKAYCECLLRVCRNTILNDRSVQITVPTVTFGQVDASRKGLRSTSFLRYRVSSMLDGASRFRDRIVSAVLVVPLAFTIAYGAIAIQRTGDWSQDRLMLSAIVNLERLNQRNTLASRP
jgi:beta-lactamase regulating signal transducer with metallopeptidase domain